MEWFLIFVLDFPEINTIRIPNVVIERTNKNTFSNKLSWEVPARIIGKTHRKKNFWEIPGVI